MKFNQDIAISTPKILLVPYDEHHVPTYHEWMGDPAIQEATASEPLTLPEEYENQVSWRTSGDKLTFIVCLPLPASTSPSTSTSASASVQARHDAVDAPDRMIGDVNVFLTPCEDEDDSEEGNSHSSQAQPATTSTTTTTPADRYCNAEIDIMIAAPAHRGRGLGSAAVCAMLAFLRRNLGAILQEYDMSSSSSTTAATTALPPPLPPLRLREVVAKIQASNGGSIALFRRLKFEARGDGRPNYFGELELVLKGGSGYWQGSEGARPGCSHGDEGGEDSWWEVEGYRELAYDRSGLS